MGCWFQTALGGATRRGLFSRQHFVGEFQISQRAFCLGIVGKGGQAVAGGFGKAHVARDGGGKQLRAEMFLQLRAHVLGKAVFPYCV